MSFPATPAARGDFSDLASRLKQVGIALLPVALLLVWTAALRLPYYKETDKDEFFFSVIAAEWLKGSLPYVATFDIKPPGLFFIYAAAQAVFGASQATIKGMEIVAVAVSAFTLYAMVRANGSERVARWVAILFPVYTLTLGGAIAVNMLLQLPFLIAAFAAALAAIRDGAEPSARLRNAFLAGLAIGAAGMVKQTAVFEAVAVFAVLVIWGEGRLRMAIAALFIAGAALPALAFAVYFLAAGYFREMFDAVVVLALQRSDADVAASYGPQFAQYFTFFGVIENSILTTACLVFLWGGALFTILRLDRIKRVFPVRLLAISGIWLAASFAGVAFGRAICSYYALTMVPPLLILAGAVFCHGLDVAPQKMRRAFVLSIAAAIACVVYADRLNFLTPNMFLAGDFDATRKVSQTIRDLGLKPDDRLLVLNRGFAVYTETGALPPSPYFHATHLLGVFHTPVADPLGMSLAANPRFIVIADPSVWHLTELPSRYKQALDYVGTHYRVAGFVDGQRDSFTIYEFAG